MISLIVELSDETDERWRGKFVEVGHFHGFQFDYTGFRLEFNHIAFDGNVNAEGQQFGAVAVESRTGAFRRDVIARFPHAIDGKGFRVKA